MGNGSSLLLFTSAFPRGHGESFVATELPYVAGRFARVAIVPLWHEPGEARPVPDNVHVQPALFSARFRRLAVLRAGASARAPVVPLLRAARALAPRPSADKLARYGYAALIVRSLLSRAELRAQLAPGGGFDLAYFYWGHGAVAAVPFLPRRIACVARFHRNDLYEELSGGYLPFRRELVASLDHLVFISEHGQRYLNDRYPGTGARSRLFRLGTPDHGPGPAGDSETYRVVSCSYVHPVKRLHLIVEALRHVDFPVEWTHLGGGPDLARIRALAADVPRNVRVRLPGNLPHAQVLEHFRAHACDLLVNASSSEGLPVSIMEALSFGIPVLATDVGGTSELVAAPFGRLMPANVTGEQIARLMAELRAAPRDAQRSGARRAWAELASAERNYPAFAEFLAAAAAGARRPS